MRMFNVEIFVGRPWFEWELFEITVECDLSAEAGRLALDVFWEERNAAVASSQDTEDAVSFVGVYSVSEVEVD